MSLNKTTARLGTICILISLIFSSPTLATETFPLPYGGCDDTQRVLRLVSPRLTGYDIVELQQRLAELGFDPGPADGVYGPRTAQAVSDFQQAHRLPATGQVDVTTWETLGNGTYQPVQAGQEKPTGQLKIVIDISAHTLTVYSSGRPFKTYPVCVGKARTPSPVGEWKVVYKSTNWGDGFGTRWLGLNVPWGIYGIHGTNKPWSIGRAESHGCVRMHNRDVEQLYSWIPLGTPVKIVGDPALPPHVPRRALQSGTSGPDVVQMQLALREAGFYWGAADGRFGRITEMGVKYWQYLNDMEPTGKLPPEVPITNRPR